MKELEDLELDSLARALEDGEYDVGAIRVRQARELILSLSSQITRLRDECEKLRDEIAGLNKKIEKAKLYTEFNPHTFVQEILLDILNYNQPKGEK